MSTTDAELRALTPDQLEACIANAVKAADTRAVEGYLMLMALRDPHRAQLVMDTIELGLTLARSDRAALSPSTPEEPTK